MVDRPNLLPEPQKPSDREARYFLITSHGRTATYWVASSLNKHPEVTCSHSKGCPPILEYGAEPPDEAVLGSHETSEAFDRKTLDEAFEELEKTKPAKVYGMVHAYSAHELFTRPHLAPGRRKPVIFNLLRHPVPRIESLKRRLLREITFSPFSRKRLESGWEVYVSPDLLENIRVHFRVDFTCPENRAFLYAASLVSILDLQDFEQPVSHLPMERLTKDMEYFTWFFRQVTQGAIEIDSGYLRDVFGTGRLNSQAEETTAVSRYERWEPWMRFAFALMKEKCVMEKRYEAIGYDLSFVRPRSGSAPLQIRYPLRYPAGPRLVEEGYRGYNIASYGAKYYALDQSLGPVDLSSLDEETMKRYQAHLHCAVGGSLEETKCLVDRMVARKSAAGETLSAGQEAMRRGDFGKAASIFERETIELPHHWEAHFWLGLVFKAQDRFEEAVSALRRAAELNPDNPILQNHLGTALYRCGDRPAAKEAFRSSLRAAPASVDALVSLAEIFRQEERYAESEAYLREAARHEPSDTNILAGLVKLSLIRGDVGTARALLQRVLESKPDYPAGPLLRKAVADFSVSIEERK